MTDGVAVVVLAAGLGTRHGGDVPKPLLLLGGRPLIAHALAAAGASGCETVLVVVSDELVADAITGAEIVRNEHPERGIASSLQVAIRTLEPRPEIRGAVVGLADQALVGAEAYRRLATADAPLAYATYGGVRGNPVRIGREYWDEATALRGDEGARALFRIHDAVAVPCDGTGFPDDVDTPDDLADLESRWRSPTASE